MSKDVCQRCGAREATVTSEAGRFCRECDELNDVEQENVSTQEELASLKEGNAQLRALGELTVQDINLLLSWVDTIDLEFGGLSQEEIALQTKLEIIREE